MLEADGGLDAIELTGGSSLSNPMYLFRGEAPRPRVRGHPAATGAGGLPGGGPRFLRDYPFEEAFFLPYARQFRDALDLPLILLGGVNRLDTVGGGARRGVRLRGHGPRPAAGARPGQPVGEGPVE